jgi:hypothetical protein
MSTDGTPFGAYRRAAMAEEVKQKIPAPPLPPQAHWVSHTRGYSLLVCRCKAKRARPIKRFGLFGRWMCSACGSWVEKA